MCVTFTKALDVQSAGLDRQEHQALLRACLHDGRDYIGNVVTIPGRKTLDAGVPSWRFGETGPNGKPVAPPDAFHLLMRSDRKKNANVRGGAADVMLHVELNVVPAAGADDEVENDEARAASAAGFDAVDELAAKRRSAVVDEICVAWGRVPWPDDLREGSSFVDVPLLGADVHAPMRLEQSAAAGRAAASMWRRQTATGKKLQRGPTLCVKAQMLNFKQSELANKLPREILCPCAMVPVLATYREIAAVEALHAARELYSNSCSPSLRLLPTLFADDMIRDEFMEVWRRMSARWSPAQLREPQARSISHWSPYDRVGVVNAVS